MTNKEVDGEAVRNPRIAALLAVHLVSQVLEDAYVIANATQESGVMDIEIEKGQPLHYQSILKHSNEKDEHCEIDDEDTSLEASKGDSDVNENKLEHVANLVATSTPQKVTELLSKQELHFIGQGDEEYDVTTDESNNSTSMFINHLFDMSEIEKVMIREESELKYSLGRYEFITEVVEKIFSDVNIAPAYKAPSLSNLVENCSNTDNSEYSFLTDASDIDKNMTYFIHDEDLGSYSNSCENSNLVPKVDIVEPEEDNAQEIADKNEVARYENAYLTLNRDYDQCSEDDADPILADPKGMTLQEVELLTANTSEENIASLVKEEHRQGDDKELVLVSEKSSENVSKKLSLVGRCRSQGAKLLASLRGWWRRRVPGKRKENQMPVVSRGLCPLSPDGRRRAASLLDQRSQRSPKMSGGVVWKFNTVNESVFQSSRWEDYTFEDKPDDCGEC